MELKSKSLSLAITIVSVAIPVLVASLFFLPRPNLHLGFDIHILPLFHAVLNGATAVLLLASLYFIRNGFVKAHKVTNIISIVLSAVFLISYVTYHSIAPSTLYGDLNHDGVLDITEKNLAGSVRYIYYLLLLSHILLAAVIVPLVLFAALYAFQNNFVKHKRLARVTWPLWFYVSITGVIVYIMISPFY
ncbi:putative membrane protein [Chitinophaga costaii]|uniref:Putative membrane protein n=1 Tax=Chitinophaga costaii TaxID=1335309 RepID=A0A1C4B117_9BACT|nr:DUF420 domain-containing protein [Chitinophaga costaii]PUZ26831.1 DUF420 domain-containing protein [Chitinophaga costaii]SCC00571.1 putative membrane protein [Chitinophaga costaii]